MTTTEDREFPVVLAAALTVAMAGRFDGIDRDEDGDGDGDGIDFEAFPAFLSAADTTDWFQAWTGNIALDGDDFRVFGQDGTGGYAAFWLVRPGRPVTEQPVVFLGSEGETGVVARDLGDFLWLLADGFGPWEAATSYEPDREARSHPELAAIAEGFAPHARRSAAAVIELAAQEFPDFDDTIMKLCR